MPIAQSLSFFQANVSQCDGLIANAHRSDHNGIPFFIQRDLEQITAAAFLNLFIAWEEYLEAAITDFMMGDPTLGGNQPTKYVQPVSREHATKMVIHTNRYFDFANYEIVMKLAKLYFENGYPIEPALSSIVSDLADLKTMRNASAHMSSTTRTALESLALRIFGQPQPHISVYSLLTSIDPRAPNDSTVYVVYRDKLLAAANLIAQG
jgi:hypothetical protein